jgi:hypothetical protein
LPSAYLGGGDLGDRTHQAPDMSTGGQENFGTTFKANFGEFPF